MYSHYIKGKRPRASFEECARASSNKMDTLDAAKKEGLELLDDMNGHPGMARYGEDRLSGDYVLEEISCEPMEHHSHCGYRRVVALPLV